MQQNIIQVLTRKDAYTLALMSGYVGSYGKFTRALKKGAVLVNTTTELFSFRLKTEGSEEVEMTRTHMSVPSTDPRLQMKTTVKRRNNLHEGQDVEFVNHVVPTVNDAYERLVGLLKEGNELDNVPTFEAFNHAIFSGKAIYYYSVQDGNVEAVHFSFSKGKKVNITYAYVCHIPCRKKTVFEGITEKDRTSFHLME